MEDVARFNRVETAIFEVPLVRPHRFARTGMDARPTLLVTVTTPGGATGVGEGARGELDPAAVARFRRN